jgi:hypothetical protein
LRGVFWVMGPANRRHRALAGLPPADSSEIRIFRIEARRQPIAPEHQQL